MICVLQCSEMAAANCKPAIQIIKLCPINYKPHLQTCQCCQRVRLHPLSLGHMNRMTARTILHILTIIYTCGDQLVEVSMSQIVADKSFNIAVSSLEVQQIGNRFIQLHAYIAVDVVSIFQSKPAPHGSRAHVQGSISRCVAHAGAGADDKDCMPAQVVDRWHAMSSTHPLQIDEWLMPRASPYHETGWKPLARLQLPSILDKIEVSIRSDACHSRAIAGLRNPRSRHTSAGDKCFLKRTVVSR